MGFEEERGENLPPLFNFTTMMFRINTPQQLRKFSQELYHNIHEFFKHHWDSKTDLEEAIKTIETYIPYPIYMKYDPVERTFFAHSDAEEKYLKYIPQLTVKYCKRIYKETYPGRCKIRLYD